MESEKDLVKRFVDYLEKKECKVFTECYNIENEKNKRNSYAIDVIFFHKDDIKFNYPVGIEFKKIGIKRGIILSEWLNQSKNYSELSFYKDDLIFKNPLIFISPMFSMSYLREGFNVSNHEKTNNFQHNNVNTFIYSSFNIGETMKYDNNIYFVINGVILYNCKANSFSFKNYDYIKKQSSTFELNK